MTRCAYILSTGGYAPAQVVPNAVFDARFGESIDEWLRANVGIRERRYMAADETTSDLAVAAARQALERAGLDAADLDLIIVATDTPDYLSPATASVVQAKLGARRAGTFDLNAACAGWVTALNQAALTMAADADYRRALVVGGYGMSRFLDPNDKYTATLFADGAGAVILAAGDKPGFLAGKLQAVGEFHDGMGIYTGGAFRPCTPETLAAFGPPRVQFVRKFPRAFNTEYWPALIQATLNKAKLSLADVDWFLFTQINLRTIEMVMTMLGQPIEKTHWVMDKWGYTGSACLPMALDDLAMTRRGLKPGQTVMFCASGGGIALAASLWRWA
ncbi:MAG: 3-ketoacyl-ACP synthase [Chloracidobacterium sp. CP2_5A]|nr:MAG: 3-ketoacyl-ACP synthase [Chloracidobacterium sp. CP2_5A]